MPTLINNSSFDTVYPNSNC